MVQDFLHQLCGLGIRIKGFDHQGIRPRPTEPQTVGGLRTCIYREREREREREIEIDNIKESRVLP